MPRLENWSIVHGKHDSPYTAPENLTRNVKGKVYGDPRFPDGKTIRTSRIIYLAPDFSKVTTKNTTYELGAMHPDYAKWYKEFNIGG